MATKTKSKPKSTTASSAYQEVLDLAEQIKNGEPATIALIEPGDVVRQGDIYLVSLDVSPASPKRWAGRQLAEGTTQGSRHVTVGDCDLFLPDPARAKDVLNRLIPGTRDQELFLGPVIEARESVTIEHPEHGHRTLPAGTYLVTYQRVWAEEVRKTMD